MYVVKYIFSLTKNIIALSRDIRRSNRRAVPSRLLFLDIFSTNIRYNRINRIATSSYEDRSSERAVTTPAIGINSTQNNDKATELRGNLKLKTVEEIVFETIPITLGKQTD